MSERGGPGPGRAWLERLRPSPLTVALLVAAAASATWAHLDARRDEAAHATLVSTRSSAWRVLPELATTAADGATVELWPAHGPAVRLVPAARGHEVWVGDEVLGPADPEAMEGVWDSLRLATTVRAASADSEAGLGDGGRIVIELPDGAGTRTLRLGRPTADGAGTYGVVEGGAEGTGGLWVLEQELSLLIQQAPEAWLARRALVVEPAEVGAVHDGTLWVERGLDGLWRGRLGDEGPAVLLDRVAVETRIDRLVSSRLDPLVDPRPEDPGQPLVVLRVRDGLAYALRQHGACPGRPDRVLVDRGPGRWGCLDAALARPWPLPGRAGDDDPGALLEPRLLPHEYGRVLRVALRGPEARVLSRYGGGWRIEEDAGGRRVVLDVSEPEVYRWYQALHEAEVSLAPPDAPWSDAPAVELELGTDSTVALRLRCAAGEPLRCRRDDGPVLEVRGRPPRVAFDVDAFAERRLASVRLDDVRAVEILPGPADGSVVRQSARFDLGVWRLDAPVHPEGDAALDSLRLEAILGTVAGLRAEGWVDEAAEPVAERILRVEQVPQRGQDPVLEVELLPGCVARVGGQRPGRLSPGACETLRQDLLVPQPFERMIDGARGLELTLDDDGLVRLARKGAAWVDAQGGPAPEATAWLERLRGRTAAGVASGEPDEPRRFQLRVRPAEGTAFVVEGGDGWARIAGQGWWYRLTDASEGDADPEGDADSGGDADPEGDAEDDEAAPAEAAAAPE